jgi:hypothetical protein
MAVSVCRSLSWKLLRGVYMMSDAVDSFVFTLTKLLVVQDCVGAFINTKPACRQQVLLAAASC